MDTPFKLATASIAGCAPFGVVMIEEHAYSLGALARLRSDGSVLSVLDEWEHNEPALQQIANALAAGGEPALRCIGVPASALRLHAPVRSRNVFCAGANYFKHVVDIIVAQGDGEETRGMNEAERRKFGEAKMTFRREHGTPFFFVKANSTMIGPYDDVSLPPDVKTMDWELELGVVIGKRARFVTQERALEYVGGYMVVNDLTIRERVNRKDAKEMGMDWVGSKCAPTALPTGPWLVPARFVGDPQQLRVTLRHNSHVMQDEDTSDMIFPVRRLIAELSRLLVLQPGDLICTGSPAGNGIHHGILLKRGDVMEGTVTGPLQSLGLQRNACVDEQVA
ncbi:MAG TPA: fumarylacetoacetate hydrolase family protein [Steroidobacteraceae bacterium]|nr:fumarylacetoacetate hydrolase family protein [Steroidobacteraceae bacterium]